MPGGAHQGLEAAKAASGANSQSEVEVFLFPFPPSHAAACSVQTTGRRCLAHEMAKQFFGVGRRHRRNVVRLGGLEFSFCPGDVWRQVSLAPE